MVLAKCMQFKKIMANVDIVIALPLSCREYTIAFEVSAFACSCVDNNVHETLGSFDRAYCRVLAPNTKLFHIEINVVLERKIRA